MTALSACTEWRGDPKVVFRRKTDRTLEMNHEWVVRARDAFKMTSVAVSGVSCWWWYHPY